MLTGELVTSKSVVLPVSSSILNSALPLLHDDEAVLKLARPATLGGLVGD